MALSLFVLEKLHSHAQKREALSLYITKFFQSLKAHRNVFRENPRNLVVLGHFHIESMQNISL